jgi:hypothetical protein
VIRVSNPGSSIHNCWVVFTTVFLYSRYLLHSRFLFDSCSSIFYKKIFFVFSSLSPYTICDSCVIILYDLMFKKKYFLCVIISFIHDLWFVVNFWTTEFFIFVKKIYLLCSRILFTITESCVIRVWRIFYLCYYPFLLNHEFNRVFLLTYFLFVSILISDSFTSHEYFAIFLYYEFMCNYTMSCLSSYRCLLCHICIFLFLRLHLYVGVNRWDDHIVN